MVRFVESDPTGLPLKRKQVAQACDRCRRRKKRCTHTDAGELIHSRKDPSSHQPSPPTKKSKSHNALPTSRTPRSPPQGSTVGVSPVTRDGTKRAAKEGHSPSTFYGDLNPEAILMEATSLCSHRDVSAPGGVGIWQAPITANHTTQGSVMSARRAVQDILKSYLWSNCLPCHPPPSDFAVLRRIYFEKMNILFPIFEEEQMSSNPPDEVTGILVEQVMSLAAAADPDATPHLRLSPEGSLLSRQEFCARLSNSVLVTLDAGLVTDRIWVTRLSAALSLYTQPTNGEEADIPAQLNSRAVHHCGTLGLHMAVDEKRDMIRTLFCCLWALDRITSAFYGRACLIHERDVGWDIEECIRTQAPPFRLLLMIINLLDKVISLYRPGTRQDNPALIELPIFEQMILDAGASKMSGSCLATLEILYHSVAILSSQSPADITSTALPSPTINSRRSLSADRITSVIGEEFAGQLSYMPFLPYGISLSLSVSYRKMRHSKIPMFRSRGQQAFRKNMLLLKSMDDMFWKSKTMVAMAEQVLQEMDRTVASLVQENGMTDPSKMSLPQGAEQETRGMDNAPATTQNQNPLAEAGNDLMLFDAVPDLDLFGHFDPTFDLGAVDAALEGNLDFGMSTNWFDWQQQWG